MKNLLLSGLILFLAGSMQAQKAEEIVGKYLDATGGSAWKDVKTLVMNAKVTAQSAPGMEIPLTISIVNKKAARVDVSVMGMTQSSCINGDKGWANNPFAGKTEAEPLTEDQVKDMKEMTDVGGTLNDYKAKGYTLEYIGTEDVEGVEAHKIKVTLNPNKTEYEFIDPDNFLLIKTATVSVIDGQEVKAESTFSNYKKSGDVMFPFTIQQDNPMMGPTVTTFNEIKVNEPIDEKIFDMPKK